MKTFKKNMEFLTALYGLALVSFDFKLAALLSSAMQSYTEAYIRSNQ